MAHVVMRHVAFAYAEPWREVFTDLDLYLDDSWRCGLTSRNGRGKSTLLHLLAGHLQPDRGSIERPDCLLFPPPDPSPGASVRRVIRAAVADFDAMEQQMELLCSRSDEAALAAYARLLEDYERLGGYTVDARIERELPALDLSPALLERRFDSLSGGEQTRALIVALFVRDNVFALIDEPTNHLDLAGRALLADYLAAQRGFLLVSHDRALLDACCDHTLALENAGPRLVHGNYSAWLADFQARNTEEAERKQRLGRQISALSAARDQRRRGALAREADKAPHTDKGYIGHRAAKQMKRAIAIERRMDAAIDEKRGLLRNVDKQRQLRLDGGGDDDAGSGALLTANGLAARVGTRLLFEHLDVQVERGARIAIVGANGCGKSTLLDILCGARPPAEGDMRVRPQLDLVRSFQQPLWSDGLLREHLQAAGLDEVRFRQVLGVLGVAADVFDTALELVSVGERKKIDLARSFLGVHDLLVWDEPLNGIDAPSREQLEDVILRDQPTLLFVEHDRRFIDTVATASIEIVAPPASASKPDC